MCDASGARRQVIEHAEQFEPLSLSLPNVVVHSVLHQSGSHFRLPQVRHLPMLRDSYRTISSGRVSERYASASGLACLIRTRSVAIAGGGGARKAPNACGDAEEG